MVIHRHTGQLSTPDESGNYSSSDRSRHTPLRRFPSNPEYPPGSLPLLAEGKERKRGRNPQAREKAAYGVCLLP